MSVEPIKCLDYLHDEVKARLVAAHGHHASNCLVANAYFTGE